MSNKTHDPAQVKAAMEAMERLKADPTVANMAKLSDIALPFLLGQNVPGYHLAPRREGSVEVQGIDKAIAYMKTLL